MTGLNRKISYSLIDSADGQFSINEVSGIIQLEKPLDRELQAVYTLSLKAVDHGLPRRLTATGTVVVSVLDINDNPPVFEYREYGATVSEDVLIGTEVLQVYAASRDIEANAEITYSIISGNEHGKFSIDSKTGNPLGKPEEALSAAGKARFTWQFTCSQVTGLKLSTGTLKRGISSFLGIIIFSGIRSGLEDFKQKFYVIKYISGISIITVSKPNGKSKHYPLVI